MKPEACLPIEPAAPGLFSMMTGWPQTCCSFSAMMRAIRSELPPAG